MSRIQEVRGLTKVRSPMALCYVVVDCSILTAAVALLKWCPAPFVMGVRTSTMAGPVPVECSPNLGGLFGGANEL